MGTLKDRWLAMRARHPRDQFGQVADRSTFGGATACTHTVWQDILDFLGLGVFTQDQLSSIAGYPAPADNPGRRGFRAENSAALIRHFRIPYRLAYGITVEELLRANDLGPCLFAVRYKDYPADSSLLTRLHGFRNGIAIEGGADQAEGFDGAHACELGYHELGPTGWLAGTMEPDHGTPGRPRVGHDVITTAQLRRAMLGLTTLPGWTATFAVIPTRAV